MSVTQLEPFHLHPKTLPDDSSLFIKMADCDTNAFVLEYVQSLAMQAGNRNANSTLNGNGLSSNGMADTYTNNAYSPAAAYMPASSLINGQSIPGAQAMYQSATYPQAAGQLMASNALNAYFPFIYTDPTMGNSATPAPANIMASFVANHNQSSMMPNTAGSLYPTMPAGSGFGNVTNVARPTGQFYGTFGAGGPPNAPQMLHPAFFAAPNKAVEHWRFGSFIPPQGKKKPLNGTSKTNLYIAGLSEEANDAAVFKLVEGVIIPKSCKALMSDGKCTGTGFIDCSTEEDAKRAKRHIEELFQKHFPSQSTSPSESETGSHNGKKNGSGDGSHLAADSHNGNAYDAKDAPFDLNFIVKDGRKLEVKYAYENEKDLFNIYVRNLPKDGFTDKELRTMFEKYGSVVSVKLLEGQRSNELTGAGFVRFSNVEDTRRAIDSINESRIFMDGCEQPLRCKLADKTDRRSTRNGGSTTQTTSADYSSRSGHHVPSSNSNSGRLSGNGSLMSKSSPSSGQVGSQTTMALLPSGLSQQSAHASHPSPQHIQQAANSALLAPSQYYPGLLNGQNALFLNSGNLRSSLPGNATPYNTEDAMLAFQNLQLQHQQQQQNAAVAAALHNSGQLNHPGTILTGPVNPALYTAGPHFHSMEDMSNYYPGYPNYMTAFRSGSTPTGSSLQPSTSASPPSAAITK